MTEDVKLSPKQETALANYKKWWGDRLESLDPSSEMKRSLYHYTDAKGLAGILQSRELWFTDIFYLNDPEEISFGLRIARKIMCRKIETSSKLVRAFFKKIEKLFTHRLGVILDFYVFSLSRKANDLGQWRAYADDGRGFAIGFSPKFLLNQFNDSVPHVFFGKAIYNRGEALCIFQETIEKAIEAIECSCASGDQDSKFLDELALSLIPSILWYSLTVKHPAYRHEEEIRLFIVKPRASDLTGLSTRTRGSKLVPYVARKLPLDEPGAITRIIIGPAVDYSETRHSVNSLLNSCGIKYNLKIWPSCIPYRAIK